MVHALVARTMRFTDPDQPRTAALRTAAVAVLTQALEAIVDPRAHTSLRQVVPHARELARLTSGTGRQSLLASRSPRLRLVPPSLRQTTRRRPWS